MIPKFVRKDINLVDFPKAAWVLNDAYRQMHSAAVGATAEGSTPTGTAAPVASAEDATAAAKSSKKVLTPTK